jgi:signal transduction histidine kinase
MKIAYINVRLGIAFALLLALLIAVGGLGLRQMGQIDGQLEEIVNKRWAKVRLAREALSYSNLNSRITMEIFFLKTKEEIDPLLAERVQNSKTISTILNDIGAEIDSPREKELFDAIEAVRRPYIESNQRGINSLVNEHRDEVARTNMVKETLPRLLAYHDAWNTFVEFQGAQMDEAAKASKAQYAATRKLTISLIVLVVLVAAAISVFATHALAMESAHRSATERELANRAEELARSNAELEQFASVASHDLQEPLRMVASYTQLLARRYKGKLDADADEFIGFAVDGATRMQGLIQDLLSYSRVTTKGQSLQLTDARAACNAALENLQSSIKDSKAVVNVGPLPAVLADATQLTQLFQNLIGNAVKYRNQRRPEIQVAARPNGDEWVLSVKDNGIGIAPQYSDRIFQMFQRLHTREEYSGTGIGLAICRKIVERHGGRIWVESRPGNGSTFLFTIPRTEGTHA